jgi:hypothetical protein
MCVGTILGPKKDKVIQFLDAVTEEMPRGGANYARGRSNVLQWPLLIPRLIQTQVPSFT